MSDIIHRMKELGNLFWRSARESGEAAADVIEQRTAIQRLSLQIKKLDKERSGLIRTIGQKVYGLHGQGKIKNQDVLADCVRVDAILADISVLQKQIERIRMANLEKGLEAPLTDTAPLTEEDEAAIATAAAVKPAGTVGEQAKPEDVGKSSEGRVEFDEEGTPLTECVEGPSQPSKPEPSCEMPKQPE